MKFLKLVIHSKWEYSLWWSMIILSLENMTVGVDSVVVAAMFIFNQGGDYYIMLSLLIKI